MFRMGYDIQKRPIFRLAKIPFPAPDDYPPGIPEEYKLPFRLLIHQHLLLEDLWIFQLRDPEDRHPLNLKAAYMFWRTHHRLKNAPHIVPFRGGTSNWLHLSMRETRVAIQKLVVMAAKNRARKKAEADAAEAAAAAGAAHEAEAAEALTELQAGVGVDWKRKRSAERALDGKTGLQGEDEEEEEPEGKKRKVSPDGIMDDDVEDDIRDECRSMKMMKRIHDVPDSDEPWVDFGTFSDFEEEINRTPKAYRDATGRKTKPEIDFYASSTEGEESEQDEASEPEEVSEPHSEKHVEVSAVAIVEPMAPN